MSPRSAALSLGAASPVRHRILQADGRRYSVKIEEAYWRFLEVWAERQGMRLSRLVQGIAVTVSDDSSLAASLRLFCLQSAAAEIDQLKRQVSGQGAGGGETRLLTVLDINPAPCLLLSHDRRIERANAAFEQWSRAAATAIVGKPYDWFFQIRANPAMVEVQKCFAAGGQDVFPARISYVAPGRIVVANAHLCLAMSRGDGEYAWTVLVESTAPVPAKSPAAKPPVTAKTEPA